MERRAEDIFKVHDLSILKSPMPAHLIRTAPSSSSPGISTPMTPISGNNGSPHLVNTFAIGGLTTASSVGCTPPAKPTPKTPTSLSLAMLKATNVDSKSPGTSFNPTLISSVSLPKWSPLGTNSRVTKPSLVVPVTDASTKRDIQINQSTPNTGPDCEGTVQSAQPETVTEKIKPLPPSEFIVEQVNRPLDDSNVAIKTPDAQDLPPKPDTKESSSIAKPQMSFDTATASIAPTNAIELSEWSLVVVPNNPTITKIEKRITEEWIVLVGKRSDMTELWHSSLISQRLKNAREVTTGSGRIYRLIGPPEVTSMIDSGFSSDFIQRFSDGFPTEWKELLVQELSTIIRRPVMSMKRKVSSSIVSSLSIANKSSSAYELSLTKEPETNVATETKQPKITTTELEEEKAILENQGSPTVEGIPSIPETSIKCTTSVPDPITREHDIEEGPKNNDAHLISHTCSPMPAKRKRGRPRKTSLSTDRPALVPALDAHDSKSGDSAKCTVIVKEIVGCDVESIPADTLSRPTDTLAIGKDELARKELWKISSDRPCALIGSIDDEIEKEIRIEPSTEEFPLQSHLEMLSKTTASEAMTESLPKDHNSNFKTSLIEVDPSVLTSVQDSETVNTRENREEASTLTNNTSELNNYFNANLSITTTSNADQPTILTTIRATEASSPTKDRQTPQKPRKKSIPKLPVLTPQSASDATSLPVLGYSRSGRRIVKPLPYWENKYITKDLSSPCPPSRSRRSEDVC